jgi:hypothetical protein
MILCEWDAPEGDPGQSCVHLFARIQSSSLTSVSIFSVCCYSIVSISVVPPLSVFAFVHSIVCLLIPVPKKSFPKDNFRRKRSRDGQCPENDQLYGSVCVSAYGSWELVGMMGC